MLSLLEACFVGSTNINVIVDDKTGRLKTYNVPEYTFIIGFSQRLVFKSIDLYNWAFY
jgi:hypothetical protein